MFGIAEWPLGFKGMVVILAGLGAAAKSLGGLTICSSFSSLIQRLGN
jgi:hypothetical protein